MSTFFELVEAVEENNRYCKYTDQYFCEGCV
jgi:hypothetical protein